MGREGDMDRPAPLRDAWGTPVEAVLDRYLRAIPARADRDEVAQRLRAALRAEPIIRGCPSLAMLRPADLGAVRPHLALAGADPAEVAATVDALRDFLDWAREAGAHALPPEAVAAALDGREEGGREEGGREGGSD